MHTLEAYLNDTAGEPVQELYAYLRDETDYPLDLIWKNMIRTMHPHEFTRNLGLTRIIQPTVQNKAQVEEIRANRRIALAMHLYFMDMLDQSMAFAAKFPPETDVFISTNEPGKKRRSKRPSLPCLCTASPCRWWKIAAAMWVRSSATWPRSCTVMITPASCTIKRPSRPSQAA